MNTNSEIFPYSGIANLLLNVISDSLAVLIKAPSESLHSPRTYSKLVQCAKKLCLHPDYRCIPRLNRHIFDGLPARQVGGFDSLPRISRICIEEWIRSQKLQTGDTHGLFIPSPLLILRSIMTIPKHKESEAYAHAVSCRILFLSYGIYYKTSVKTAEFDIITNEDIITQIDSIRIYALHRDNIHTPKNNHIAHLLRHYLALRGSFRLRFGTSGKKIIGDVEKSRNSALEWLSSRNYTKPFAMRDDIRHGYEFRISHGQKDIPETQQLINEITGVPIAIPGADVVFFGGLRRSDSNSIVISISGTPGTGKTSLSLALATSLAPFGTKCLYYSFEEGPGRLRSRLSSLRPQYFRGTTLLTETTEDWFFPVRIDRSKNITVDDLLKSYIQPLESRLHAKQSEINVDLKALPAIAPLIIIVDGLAALTDDKCELAYARLLEVMRNLECIVILLSADGLASDSRLEYHVDTVVKLRYSGTDCLDNKPVRLFQLDKSRLQLSRSGSHIFHITGDEGLRFAPQLSSQLDLRKIEDFPLPDQSKGLAVLFCDRSPKDNNINDRLVTIFEGSRVLLYGHGSSGKAGLGLKILMAPLISLNSSREEKIEFPFKEERVLAVSFLYPEEYYRKLASRILRLGRGRFGKASCSTLDTIFFPPGYQRPEDFIQKIINALNEAIFEGKPFSRILIDGVHNVFLQFPNMEKEDMIWPTLYSLLAKYNLTVVTTFTTFVGPGSFGTKFQHLPDAEFVLKGHRPLLHALVQGADYFLQIEKPTNREVSRRYLVCANSAIHQALPDKGISWDAGDLIFDSFEQIERITEQTMV